MGDRFTPRTLVLSALATGGLLLAVHGASLRREAELSGERFLLAPLVAPTAWLAEATGLDEALQRWGALRDRWYDALSSEPPPLIEEPEAPGADELEALEGSSDGSGRDAADEADEADEAQPSMVAGSAPAKSNRSPLTGENDDAAPTEEGSAQPAAQERDPLLVEGGGGTTGGNADPGAAVIRRVLIIGASSIEGALGIELERRLERIPGVKVLRWGRHSTGLARLDYFDWLEKTRTLAAGFHPDLVLAQFGGNDGQAITRPSGGVVAAVHSRKWERRYESRMREFLQVLSKQDAKLVYLGMPIPRDEVVRRRMALANRASKAAVEAAGERYLSTWEFTASPAGGYLTTMKIGDRERGLRAPDGFHLSTVGSGYVAGRIISYVRANYTLPDEEQAPAEDEGEQTLTEPAEVAPAPLAPARRALARSPSIPLPPDAVAPGPSEPDPSEPDPLSPDGSERGLAAPASIALAPTAGGPIGAGAPEPGANAPEALRPEPDAEPALEPEASGAP